MTKRALALAAWAAPFALTEPAAAQGLSLGGGAGDQPIEILARDGIEWHRETQRYIARGNARAQQATTVVEADTLTAYYREKSGEGLTFPGIWHKGSPLASHVTAKQVGTAACPWAQVARVPPPALAPIPLPFTRLEPVIQEQTMLREPPELVVRDASISVLWPS